MGAIVSVVIPVYNVQDYLDRCIQSVLKQTLKDIEIILVDDGSPDGCPALCDAYVAKDERIKVIHKTNAGLGMARNTGLAVATGEYVAFVDSDDFIEVNMYECLYKEALKYDADVVFSDVRFYRNGNVRIRHDVDKTLSVRGREAVCNYLLDYVAPEPECNRNVKYMMSVWRAIYRRDVIEQHNIRFLSERVVVSEDMPFNIDFLKYALCVVHSNKAFYNYCFNQESLSKNHSMAKNDRRIALLNCVKERLSFLPESKFLLHYQRFVLLALRQILAGDLSICKQEGLSWKKQYHKRINQEPYRETLATYPIKRMPIKFRFFYSIIKFGSAALARCLLTINK